MFSLRRGGDAEVGAAHRSPKRPKTVLSGGRLREMTWWSQTNFFRDHLYHCYGFYLDRLDTPSSFSLISENQLIFCFSAIFDTKFSRYPQFEGTSSLSSVFVQLNSVSSVKKLWKNWVSYLSGGLMLPATNVKKKVFWLHGFCHGYIHGIYHAYHTHFWFHGFCHADIHGFCHAILTLLVYNVHWTF